MSRALSPVVGVVLLTAVTVIASVAVGAAALSHAPPDPAPRIAVDATAAPDGRVTLVHRGGDAVSVADLRVHVTVDGDPLGHQPPVPFVGAPGFRGAPSGPFNRAGDGTWTTGEEASFTVAATNRPSLHPGATVRVRLVEDGTPVAEVTATA